MLDCPCTEGTFDYRALETVELGQDSHYAESSLKRCKLCGIVWLRYFHENEGFSRSGQWYCGAVTEEQARCATPETTADILAQLPDGYWCGGSFFDGRVHRSSGKIRI